MYYVALKHEIDITRSFYIFTIITNDTYQIITLRMTPTTIPSERSLSYIFATFADVESHTGMTCQHPVSSGCEMSSLPLSPSLSDSRALQILSLPGGSHLSTSSPTSSTGPVAQLLPSLSSLPAMLALAPRLQLLHDPCRVAWARARCCNAPGLHPLAPAAAPGSAPRLHAREQPCLVGACCV